MVGLRELPISGEIKRDFEGFLAKTGSIFSDWELTEVEENIPGIPTARVGKPLSSSCEVCGHGIKHVCIFERKTGSEAHLGVVCASNLIAINKYGSLDKLNFARKVKLEKKTILKKLLEFQAQQEKLKIEVKYFEEVKWLNELFAKVLEKYPNLYGIAEGGYKFSSAFYKHLQFFQSVKVAFERGKMTDNMALAVRKSMREKSIDQRVKELEDYVNYLIEQAVKQEKIDQASHKLRCLYKVSYTGGGIWFNYSMWEGHRSFLASVIKQYDEKRFLSDKQIEVINKIHDKYCQDEGCKPKNTELKERGNTVKKILNLLEALNRPIDADVITTLADSSDDVLNGILKVLEEEVNKAKKVET